MKTLCVSGTLLALLCSSDMTLCLCEETTRALEDKERAADGQSTSHKFPLCKVGTTNVVEQTFGGACHCNFNRVRHCGCNRSILEHRGPWEGKTWIYTACDLICMCPSSPYAPSEDITCCDPYVGVYTHLVAAYGEIIAQPRRQPRYNVPNNKFHGTSDASQWYVQERKYVLYFELYSDSSCSHRIDHSEMHVMYADDVKASKCMHMTSSGEGGSWDSKILCNADGTMGFFFYFPPPDYHVSEPTCNGPAASYSDSYYDQSAFRPHRAMGADVMNGTCYMLKRLGLAEDIRMGEYRWRTNQTGSYAMSYKISSLSNVTLPRCEKTAMVGYKFVGFGVCTGKYGVGMHNILRLKHSSTTPEQCRAFCSSLDACVGHSIHIWQAKEEDLAEFHESVHVGECRLFLRAMEEIPASASWKQGSRDTYLGLYSPLADDLWEWDRDWAGYYGHVSEVAEAYPEWVPDDRGMWMCYKKLYRCSTNKFGIDFCNTWCNTPGHWGCDAYTLTDKDGNNTDNLDYTCSCAGCNGCAESTSPYAVSEYGVASCASGYVNIASESSCIAASLALGLTYNSTEENPTMPSGCSKKSDNKVYFNRAPNGEASPQFAQVCTEPVDQAVKVSLTLEGSRSDVASFAVSVQTASAIKLVLAKHTGVTISSDLNLTVEVDQCLPSDLAGGKAIVTVDGVVSTSRSGVQRYIGTIAHFAHTAKLFQEYRPLKFQVPVLDLAPFKILDLTAVPLLAATPTKTTTPCAWMTTTLATTNRPHSEQSNASVQYDKSRSDQALELDADNCHGNTLVTGFALTMILFPF